MIQLSEFRFTKKALWDDEKIDLIQAFRFSSKAQITNFLRAYLGAKLTTYNTNINKLRCKKMLTKHSVIKSQAKVFFFKTVHSFKKSGGRKHRCNVL